MNELLSKLDPELQEQLRQQAQPESIQPMLATLTDDYFSDPGWIFERKLDGERCLVYKQSGAIKLGSRNKKDLSKKYPELVSALEKTEGTDYIADGEIVAFTGNTTSFSKLQYRMQNDHPTEEDIESTPVFLYLFDLIHLDGYDLSQIPLRKRKYLLRKAIAFKDPIRFLNHRNEEGEAMHRKACEKGWEGVIAKEADSTYVHSRSRKWLKFKCTAQQELVIGGYTDPKGERIGFGALLVGYYENDELQYAGKVGTGFDNELLEKLHDQLKKLKSADSPFTGEIDEKGVQWTKPELVAQIGFTEWTQDNKLRHPRFLGLREDKAPQDVTKEKTAML